MARGGKREGAGRRKILTIREQLMVGIFYDNIWKRWTTELYREYIDGLITEDEYDGDFEIDESDKNYPILEKYFKIDESEWPEDIPDVVVDEIYRLNNVGFFVFFCENVRQLRPYRFSNETTELVQEWAHTRFRVTLKKSYIRHCREFYHARRKARTRRL